MLRVNRSVEVYKGILRNNRKVPERYSRKIPEEVEDRVVVKGIIVVYIEE